MVSIGPHQWIDQEVEDDHVRDGLLQMRGAMQMTLARITIRPRSKAKVSLMNNSFMLLSNEDDCMER